MAAAPGYSTSKPVAVGRSCTQPAAWATPPARRGDFATMDGWFDKGLLKDLDDNTSSALSLARHDGSEGEHSIQVLDWWLERGLPWGDRLIIQADLELASGALSEDLSLQALEWWRVHDHLMIDPPDLYLALAKASRRGYVQVLDWWWMHYESSVECATDMIERP